VLASRSPLVPAISLEPPPPPCSHVPMSPCPHSWSVFVVASRLPNHVKYLTHFIHFAGSKCSYWFAGYTKDHLRCFGLSGTSIGSQAVCALGSQTQPVFRLMRRSWFISAELRHNATTRRTGGGPLVLGSEMGVLWAVGRFMCYLDHLQATSPTDHLPTSDPAVLSGHPPHCTSATVPHCALATY
jgi:hypothetical protein